MENASDQQPPRIHLGWVLLLGAGGVLITGLAFCGRFVTGIGDNDLGVWQSILTNFGVGILSAAVLLLFEPKFRRVVTNTVTTATADVKREVRAAVQADIDERLTPLTNRIDSLYDATLAEQEATISELANDFTHERVMKTFSDASDVSALFSDGIRVQAENEPGKLHIGMQLRIPNQLHTSFAAMAGPIEVEEEALHLSASGDNGLWAEVIWEPGDDFTVPAMELAKELSRRRARGFAEKINWDPVLSRFVKGIKVAVDASNKIPGAIKMDGALVEMAGSDFAPWYLTTDGLYHPGQNWHLPRRSIGINSGWPNNQPTKEVEMPSWADKNEWDYIIGRARFQYSNW